MFPHLADSAVCDGTRARPRDAAQYDDGLALRWAPPSPQLARFLHVEQNRRAATGLRAAQSSAVAIHACDHKSEGTTGNRTLIAMIQTSHASHCTMAPRRLRWESNPDLGSQSATSLPVGLQSQMVPDGGVEPRARRRVKTLAGPPAFKARRV